MSTERRRSHRHPTWLNVTLEGDGSAFGARVSDVSLDGLHLHCARAVLPFTRVVVRLQLDVEICFTGEVRWVLDTLDEELTVYEMGVAVEAVSAGGVRAVGLAQKYRLMQRVIDDVSLRRAG